MKWDIKSIWSNIWVKFIVIALVVLSNYSTLLTFQPINIHYTIDGSALFAISKTRTLTPPLIIGKDIGYTYGPLSSLWGPVLPDSNLSFHVIGLIISILLIILTIYLLIALARNANGWRFWSLVILVALFPFPDMSMCGFVFAALVDVPWIQLGLMLAVTSLFGLPGSRLKSISLPLLSLLAALGMFLKFTIGFHLFFLFIVTLCINIISKTDKRLIYATVGIYLTSLLSIWFVLTGGGLTAFFTYLVHGFQTSSYYSEFKIINLFSGFLYLLPLAIVILNVIFGFYIGGIGLGAILLCNSFLLFKHGFVSADTHMFSFFIAEWFVLFCLAGLITIKKTTLKINIAYISLILFWFIGYQGVRYGVMDSRYLPTEIFTGLGNVTQIFQPVKNFNAAKNQTISNLVDLRERHKNLFDKLDKYCSPEKTITFLPWDLYFAGLVKSRWQPLPTFQLYVSAWMPGFMARDKALFYGDSPPDFIVLGQEGLDDRSPVAEMSHILPAIIERYEVLDKADGYLILKLRKTRLVLKYAGYDAGLNGSKLIFIKSAGMKRQPWFEIQKLFFKGPQFSIVIALKDGKYLRYRVHATQLERGVFFSLPGVRMEDLFYPGVNNALNGPLTVMFIPEVFADISIRKSPLLKLQTCYLTAE